jgi:DNA-binding XRE family transcriptional regulator
MGQEDFAKELGVAFSTINLWENGKTKPNYKGQLKSCAKNIV